MFNVKCKYCPIVKSVSVFRHHHDWHRLLHRRNHRLHESRQRNRHRLRSHHYGCCYCSKCCHHEKLQKSYGLLQKNCVLQCWCYGIQYLYGYWLLSNETNCR